MVWRCLGRAKCPHIRRTVCSELETRFEHVEKQLQLCNGKQSKDQTAFFILQATPKLLIWVNDHPEYNLKKNNAEIKLILYISV